MKYFKQACSGFIDKEAEPDSDLASDLLDYVPAESALILNSTTSDAVDKKGSRSWNSRAPEGQQNLPWGPRKS